MAFYIYQNVPTNKVTIHRGDCKFCNSGHGVQQNPLGDANGQWFIAPDNGYADYTSAATAAGILAANMNAKFHNCQKCNPHI